MMNQPDTPTSTDQTPSASSPGVESQEMHWYVVKVQSNREKSIRDNLIRRIRQEGMDKYFGEIIIPTEKVIENKAGKKKIREIKLYPGYLMIQMIITDESWYLVRSTAGVGDFAGATGRPVPMLKGEVERMLGVQAEMVQGQSPQRIKTNLYLGCRVKVRQGSSFDGFQGEVSAVDETTGKVTVMIQILGRTTPVELEYWQVARLDEVGDERVRSEDKDKRDKPPKK